MMVELRHDRTSRVYRSYEEFRAQFYETTRDASEEKSEGATPSFGKRLAKRVVNEALAKQGETETIGSQI